MDYWIRACPEFAGIDEKLLIQVVSKTNNGFPSPFSELAVIELRT